jgi:holo-[acyl-carrier protein] synthase
MIGIGLDAVDVARFRRVLARRPRLAERLFTAGERAYAARRADPTERLAARFAAKEALLKSLGVGIGAAAFHDIEVVATPSGAPRLALRGRAAALAESVGVVRFELSLTHTHTSAQAVVVALGA